jgi:Protein phosphatase 2C
MGVGLTASPGAWKVVSASTVGARHAAAKQGCDDAHAHWQAREGVVLLVADGAGSAPRAADGAKLAVTAAQIEAADLLGRADSLDPYAVQAGLASILIAARTALEKLAAGDDGHGPVAIADLATTLTAVLAWPELVGVAQIGDGAVVLRRGSGQLELLVAPPEREYVNETSFLTSEAYMDKAQILVTDAADISGISVMTDGLHLLALDLVARVPHPPFFEPLFAFAAGDGALDEELDAFLGSESVCARTDDDKTLILAVRRAE